MSKKKEEKPDRKIVAVIREAMRDRNMTTHALATLTGLPTSTLYEAFRRDGMTCDTADRCIAVLGLHVTSEEGDDQDD